MRGINNYFYFCSDGDTRADGADANVWHFSSKEQAVLQSHMNSFTFLQNNEREKAGSNM